MNTNKNIVKKMTAAEKIELAGRVQNAITTNHTAKMAGLASVSTSVLLNPYCKARRAAGSCAGRICSECFAAAQLKRFKHQTEKLAKNTELFTSQIIPAECLPVLWSPSGYFRFEAFGDLINETQVVNYFNMARKSPAMHCALWTKNPNIIKQAIKHGAKKPRNLVIVYSSEFINVRAGESIKRLFPFIDKIFTVYKSEKEAAAAGVEINCGARSCATCGRCYENKGGVYVNELLK